MVSSVPKGMPRVYVRNTWMYYADHFKIFAWCWAPEFAESKMSFAWAKLINCIVTFVVGFVAMLLA